MIKSQGIFFPGELSCVCVCVCVCVCCVPVWFQAIWSRIGNRQNKERKLVTYSKSVTALSYDKFPMAGAQDPPTQIISQGNFFFFVSCSIAWQAHYHVFKLVYICKSRRKNFFSKRRYPVIWQKWHLLSGYDYTTTVQIMVLHTEINLEGVLSWHSPNKILDLEALGENIFMLECVSYVEKSSNFLHTNWKKKK